MGALLAACAGPPPKPGVEFSIVQNGRAAGPALGANGAMVYSLRRGEPFTILVPKPTPDRAGGSGHLAPIRICASADPGIFSGIGTGRSIGTLQCLNGATAMAGSASDSPRGVDLLVSKGDAHNAFDERNSVMGLHHTAINVRQIVDFEVIGKRCYGNTCLDKTRGIPFTAPALHLVVFSNANGNGTVDAGEYILVTLRLEGA